MVLIIHTLWCVWLLQKEIRAVFLKLFLLYYSSIAQSVEQVAVNHWVGGSNPSRGAILAPSFLYIILNYHERQHL